MEHRIERRPPQWSNHPHIDLQDGTARILIVDDYELGATALSEYLATDAMSCRVALRGADAIMQSVIWQPHIVVLDISMPILNGFDTARSLRDADATKHISIVAVTALDESAVQKHSRGDEFDGYCHKDNSPAVLSAFLMSAFN